MPVKVLNNTRQQLQPQLQGKKIRQKSVCLEEKPIRILTKSTFKFKQI